MVINDKIRILREINNLTQDEMAEKMQMSTSGYSKIERGKSKISMERLEQIANIFNIDVMELLTKGNGSSFSLLSESTSQSNYYGNSDSLNNEINKLKLIIQHKEELLRQKEVENSLLKTLVEALQKQNSQ